MHAELSVSNYRAFNHQVILRIRPITILVGPNNSGKSSVLSLLHALRDMTRPPPPGHQSRTVPPNPLRLSSHQGSGEPQVIASLTYTHDAAQDPDSADTHFMRVTAPAGPQPGSPEIVTWCSHHPPHLPPRHPLDAIHRYLRAMRTTPTAPRALPQVMQVPEEAPEDVGPRGQNALAVLFNMQQQAEARPSPPDAGPDIQADAPFVQHHLRALTGAGPISLLQLDPDQPGIVWPTTPGHHGQGHMSLAHQGSAVTQCLPLLVQAAMMNPGSTLVLKHPETALDPRARLHLGDLLADLWRHRLVPSITETQSDSILLRLRRLVARGDLDPQDLSLAFFTTDPDVDDNAAIRNIDVNPDGSLGPGLPMAFFGADIRDALEMGARH